jgi:hypothetical protein
MSTTRPPAHHPLIRGVVVAIATFLAALLAFGALGNIGPYELAIVLAITATAIFLSSPVSTTAKRR